MNRATFTQPGHGIPAMVDRILVLVDGGNLEPGEDDLVFTYVPRTIQGRSCGHLAFVYDIETTNRPGRVKVTLEDMRAFGGSYAGSSDSRFSSLTNFYGAIPIHDDYHV
jgi:hypothetical protein